MNEKFNIDQVQPFQPAQGEPTDWLGNWHPLAEQLGSVYIPTYAIVVTFLIMVLVLAVRPQGLLARR